MGTFSPTHWFIVLAMFTPLMALLVVPTWRILQRAGFNGAWSLLMLVPLVGFVVLWVLAFVKWPNDNEGSTRTSVPWIVAGFVMVPLSVVAVMVMSSANVRQVATVEQRTRPEPQQEQSVAPQVSPTTARPVEDPKYLSDRDVGLPSQPPPAEKIDWEKGTFAPPSPAK